MSHETKVRVGDRTYLIPDIWLAGFCQSNHCSTADAIAWWHAQEIMAEQEAAND
jgi:hypothetical protein